jgi:hypothetical protein
MAGSRFIMRYKGDVAEASKELEQLQAKENLQVVDCSSPKSVLVEASTNIIEHIKKVFSNWHVFPEQTYSLPNSRVKLNSSYSKRRAS